MGMLPTYILQDAYSCVETACWRQLKSMQPPTADWQELAKLYVHPDDHPVCHRAMSLYAKSVTGQCYRHRIELPSGWQSEVRVHVKAEDKFFFPEIPTLDIDRESEFYRSILEWVEWDEDLSTRWANVRSMIQAFDDSGQPVSVLKELWPDFDLLFDVREGDGYMRRSGNGVNGWVEKYRQLGRPRSFDMPVPNCMTHLNDVRRTVLSVTLMPKSFEHPPAKDAEVHMSRKVDLITTPWGTRVAPVTGDI